MQRQPHPVAAPGTDAARQVATQLAEALEKKDLTPVTFAGTTGAQTNALFQPLVRGMGDVDPVVDVTAVTPEPTQATLTYRWTFPGVAQPWTYDATVALARDGGTWRPTWSPSLLQPGLDGTDRLSQHRLYPARGEVLGEDGEAIVKKRSVVRIGIDKANLAADRQKSSATRLAKLVGVDPTAYARLVPRSGAQAFVPAIVFRAQDPDRPTNREVFAIPGALPVQDDAMLPPTRDFAAALLGRVGPATAEVVKASDGAVTDGDEVGLSGLEKRYDEAAAGHARAWSCSWSPPPGPRPAPRPEPPRATASRPPPRRARRARRADHRLRGEGGRRQAARDDAEPRAATARGEVPREELRRRLPRRRPSVHRRGARRRQQPGHRRPGRRTSGQVQPGSTFKVASALALLRAGLRPGSPVECPRTVRVGGRTYENYDDYPSNHLGRIDFRTAFAQSCNTAFIGQRDKLGASDLREAAGVARPRHRLRRRLPGLLRLRPGGGNDNARAEAIFGQGKDQVSPLAMALVASERGGGAHRAADPPRRAATPRRRQPR